MAYPTFVWRAPAVSVGYRYPSCGLVGVFPNAGTEMAPRSLGASLFNGSRAWALEVIEATWVTLAPFLLLSPPPSQVTVDLVTSDPGGGQTVIPVAFDPDYGLPAEVVCRARCEAPTGTTLRRVPVSLVSETTPTPQTPIPRLGRAVPMFRARGAQGPGVVIHEGEGIAIRVNPWASDVAPMGPWTVGIKVMQVSNGACFAYLVSEVMFNAGEANDIVLFNGSGSGESVELLEVEATLEGVFKSAASWTQHIGLFHIRDTGKPKNPDNFARDVTSSVVPRDSSFTLPSGVEATIGAQLFQPFAHIGPTMFYPVDNISATADVNNDVGANCRVRRIQMQVAPAAFTPTPKEELLFSSRANAQTTPLRLNPGHTLALGLARPGPQQNFDAQAYTSQAIGDFEVTFRVVPVRGKPSVRVV